MHVIFDILAAIVLYSMGWNAVYLIVGLVILFYVTIHVGVRIRFFFWELNTYGAVATIESMKRGFREKRNLALAIKNALTPGYTPPPPARMPRALQALMDDMKETARRTPPAPYDPYLEAATNIEMRRWTKEQEDEHEQRDYDRQFDAAQLRAMRRLGD